MGIVYLARDREPRRFAIQCDQVIPRPFCAQSPAQYLAVQGPVAGSPYRALVDDRQATSQSGPTSWVAGELHQTERPRSGGRGRMAETLRVGGEGTGYDKTVQCTPRG